MWELDINGTLMNSYSGLCATVQTLTANVVPKGIRSWVATGRRGEVYLALFNLDQVKTLITAQLLNLAKVLPGINFRTSYRCNAVWSGRECYIRAGSVSMTVESHGAVT